jgi:hypothetical protein
MWDGGRAGGDSEMQWDQELIICKNLFFIGNGQKWYDTIIAIFTIAWFLRGIAQSE